jgi:hypothetical protein
MKKASFVCALGLISTGFQEKTYSSWIPQATLSANVTGSSEGVDVALSADGSTLAAGAPYYNHIGTVEIYVRSESSWTHQAYLPASEQNLGAAVALSADGNTLAWGTPGYANGYGQTIILGRSSGTWSVLWGATQFVANSNEGWAVALSSDGTTLAAGAYIYGNTGATQVYVQDGYQLNHQATLSQKYPNSFEGISVSLSADGNTLAAGAYGTNNNTGATQIYFRTGTSWTYQATLSQNISGSMEGSSVALSADGNTLAVGAPAYDNNTGTVHVYTRTGTAWSLQASLSNSSSGSYEGDSVSLSADGNTLAVTATSSTQIYFRSGSQWSHQQALYLSAAGASVALSADNSTLAVGAPEYQLLPGETFIYSNDQN